AGDADLRARRVAGELGPGARGRTHPGNAAAAIRPAGSAHLGERARRPLPLRGRGEPAARGAVGAVCGVAGTGGEPLNRANVWRASREYHVVMVGLACTWT